MSNTTGKTAAAVNTTFRSALFGASSPFLPANMLAGWVSTQTYVLRCDASTGILTTDTNTTSVIGTRVASGMPVNTSVVVQRQVTPAGRQYRGRILSPPTYLDKSFVDQDGLITASQVTILLAQWLQFRSVLSAQSNPAFLMHNPPQGGGATPAPTAINQFVVRTRIGTIRHRIRR